MQNSVRNKENCLLGSTNEPASEEVVKESKVSSSDCQSVSQSGSAKRRWKLSDFEVGRRLILFLSLKFK